MHLIRTKNVLGNERAALGEQNVPWVDKKHAPLEKKPLGCERTWEEAKGAPKGAKGAVVISVCS